MALVASVLVARAALAAPPPTPEAQAEAKRLYEEGTNAYNLSEYKEAIEKYRAAFKLVPKPFFLYNIAQAYRLNGDLKPAEQFYKNFLNALPDAPNRAEVEAQIQSLEDAIAKQDQSVKQPPTGAVNPDHTRIPSPDKAGLPPSGRDLPALADSGRSRPIYKKWWFWAGIGAVAAGTVAVVVVSSGKSVSVPGSDLGNRKVFQ
jgi:tetratricopeptide (TPR) repeat protein